MQHILSYIFILVPLAVIDAVWLISMIGTYKKYIGHLFAETPSFLPVFVFYIIYTLGVYILVIQPQIALAGSVQAVSLLKVFLVGAFLGLVAYGTYDLTNQATLKDWPVLLTVTDMVWGAFLTGISSTIAMWGIKLWIK